MNNINTQVVQEYLEKGNRILYLTLKKKPDSQEVVEELMKELRENMNIFLQNIYPKIKDQKFDDFEKTFKLILIKGLIQILEKMLIKYYGQLLDEDKKLIEQILKEEKLPPSENSQENPQQNQINYPMNYMNPIISQNNPQLNQINPPLNQVNQQQNQMNIQQNQMNIQQNQVNLQQKQINQPLGKMNQAVNPNNP